MRNSAFFAMSATILAGAMLSACGGPGGGPGSGRLSGSSGDPALQHGAIVVKPAGLLLIDMDTNRDLDTDSEELANSTPDLFAQIDQDNGGVLSALEFANWAQTALGTRYPTFGMARFDTDNSLGVEADEFATGLQTLFASYDKDNNGRVSRAELFTQLNTDPRGGQGGRPSGGPGSGQGGPGNGGPGGGRPVG